jgi:hypothetical protein
VGFRIGDVLQHTWGVLSRHFLTFLLLVGIADLIPVIFSVFADVRQGPAQFAHTLLLFTLSSFAHGIVVFAAFQDLRGRPVDALSSFQCGLARLLPLVALTLLYVVLLLGGLLLCIAPGLLVLAALPVISPVCVVERSGPIRSIRRSVALTRGCRWPILAVEVSWFVLFAVTLLIVRAALGPGETFPKQLAQWVFNTPLGTFLSVFHAILYHDLRAMKEGIGIKEIAAVFD